MLWPIKHDMPLNSRVQLQCSAKQCYVRLGLSSLAAYSAVAAPCPDTGWFTSAAFLGGFSSDAQGGNTGAAATAAVKTWAVGVPLGIVLRTVSRGYLPAVSFMAVSMGVTGVLMVGWRAALAAATPEVRSVDLQYNAAHSYCWTSIKASPSRQEIAVSYQLR